MPEGTKQKVLGDIPSEKATSGLSTNDVNPVTDASTLVAKAAASTSVATHATPAPSAASVMDKNNHLTSQQASYLEYGNLKFIIMDSPTDSNIMTYIGALEKRKCSLVVRACSPTYDARVMEKHGIRVMDIPFEDGDAPPEQELRQFLDTSKKWFDDRKQSDSYIAVHCAAGLGRAPALVTIALMETGMKFHDAVAFVRRKRRGAINAKQLKYLQSYKVEGGAEMCCTIL
jgi:protein tyrosine phosphatase type IVA